MCWRRPKAANHPRVFFLGFPFCPSHENLFCGFPQQASVRIPDDGTRFEFSETEISLIKCMVVPGVACFASRMGGGVVTGSLRRWLVVPDRGLSTRPLG